MVRQRITVFCLILLLAVTSVACGIFIMPKNTEIAVVHAENERIQAAAEIVRPGPYAIRNEAELRALAAAIENGTGINLISGETQNGNPSFNMDITVDPTDVLIAVPANDVPYAEYRLFANIFMNGGNFYGIGTETNPFRGKFVGWGEYDTQNHLFGVVTRTIDTNQIVMTDRPAWGIFTYASGDVYIQSITVSGTVGLNRAVTDDLEFVGGIIGRVQGGNVTLKNVIAQFATMYIDIAVTALIKPIYIGGLIGAVDEGSLTILHSTVQTGRLTGPSYVGGMFGYVGRTGPVDLFICNHYHNTVREDIFGCGSGNRDGGTSGSLVLGWNYDPYIASGQTETVEAWEPTIGLITGTLGNGSTVEVLGYEYQNDPSRPNPYPAFNIGGTHAGYAMSKITLWGEITAGSKINMFDIAISGNLGGVNAPRIGHAGSDLSNVHWVNTNSNAHSRSYSNLVIDENYEVLLSDLSSEPSEGRGLFREDRYGGSEIHYVYQGSHLLTSYTGFASERYRMKVPVSDPLGLVPSKDPYNPASLNAYTEYTEIYGLENGSITGHVFYRLSERLWSTHNLTLDITLLKASFITNTLTLNGVDEPTEIDLTNHIKPNPDKKHAYWGYEVYRFEVLGSDGGKTVDCPVYSNAELPENQAKNAASKYELWHYVKLKPGVYRIRMRSYVPDRLGLYAPDTHLLVKKFPFQDPDPLDPNDGNGDYVFYNNSGADEIFDMTVYNSVGMQYVPETDPPPPPWYEDPIASTIIYIAITVGASAGGVVLLYFFIVWIKRSKRTKQLMAKMRAQGHAK